MTMEDTFYRRLITAAPFGYANYVAVPDAAGNIIDYECLEGNSIFEGLTGLSAVDTTFLKLSQGIPGLTNSGQDWIAIFNGIAAAGDEKECEVFSDLQKRWYKMYAYASEQSHIVTLFFDITKDKLQSVERTRAEEHLATERNLLLTMINTIPDRIYVKDKNCRFILNNAAHLAALGAHAQSDVVGKTDNDFRTWEPSTAYSADDTHVLQSRAALYNREESTILPTGEHGTMLTNKAPFFDAKGGVIGLVSVSRDISSRKRMEDELKKSEARFRTVSRLSSDFAYSCTHVGFNSFVDDWITDAFFTLTGYDEKELREKQSWLFTVHTQDRSRVFTQFNAVRVGESIEHEFRLVTKDGNVVWVNNKIECVADYTASGKGRIFGAVKNITEHTMAEQALRDERWRLESIIEGTHVGTWEWNVQTGETVFNEMWAQIIGYSLDELRPLSIAVWEKFAHPEDLQQSEGALLRHFAGETAYYDFESRMKHKDGRWVWVHDRGRVITRTADGKPLMMFGTHTDITVRKEREETLRESEELHRIILLTAMDGYWVADIHGNLSEVNEAYSEMSGYSNQELLAMRISELEVSESSADTADHMKKVIVRGEDRFESKHRRKDGSVFDVEVSVQYNQTQGGRFVCFLRDITRHESTEKTFSENE